MKLIPIIHLILGECNYIDTPKKAYAEYERVVKYAMFLDRKLTIDLFHGDNAVLYSDAWEVCQMNDDKNVLIFNNESADIVEVITYGTIETIINYGFKISPSKIKEFKL